MSNKKYRHVKVEDSFKMGDLQENGIVSIEGLVYYCATCAIEYDIGFSGKNGKYAAGYCGICHRGSPFIGAVTFEEFLNKTGQSAKEEK